MPLGFLLKAVSGCDFDSDEQYISPQHAAFIKNMSMDLNENGSAPDGTAGTEGDNKGKFTPIESTETLCPMPLPEGENYCIGYYESKDTNEGYVFVYNTLNNHLIYMIDGYTSKCTLLKESPCWNFKLDPRHFISFGRCTLQVIEIYNKATGQNEKRRYLIFTDNSDTGLRFLSVLDAIATMGFSFAFFQNDNCRECDLLSLDIPTPNSCIGITPIERAANDNRDNLINNKAFQFRIKNIDVWGRESEHGIISDPWYSTVGACLKESSGQPRCLDLTFDAGCATIVKTQIEYRVWNANDPQISVPTDWYLHDTIDKYDQTDPRLNWWQREINQELNYNRAQNTITYRFCADKGTTALPPEETRRNENPIPFRASSVVSANKSIATANHDRGKPPLDKLLLRQITFGVQRPAEGAACVPKPRTITVYGHIRGLHANNNQRLRKQDGKTVYGSDHSSLIFEFNQALPAGQDGFVAYFAGSNEYAISTQCRYNIETKEIVEVGVDDYFKGLNLTPFQYETADLRYIPVQKWVFPNTTPGKKVVRFASQTAVPTGDYQKTSIPISGTTPFPDVSKYLHEDAHEIVIDQCEGDVDLLFKESVIICDLTSANGGARRITNVCQGYLYEDEVSKVPIEKASVDAPNHATKNRFTDHNGFYWAMSVQKGWHADLFSTKKCKRRTLMATSSNTVDAPGARYRNEKLYAYKGTQQFPSTDRIYIKGRVVSCDAPTQGISGVLVVLTGGSTAVSDENGNYTILAHDRGDTVNRVDKLKIAQKGLCSIGTCDDPCSTCFPDFSFGPPPCTGQDRIFNVPVLQVKIKENNLRGPQNGGRYELGIVPFYGAGHPQFVQRLPSHVLDIPTIGENGVYGFSKITYSIGPDVVFPAGVRYFTIVISKNLNWDNFLTWVVEKVEFVDNTGNQNVANPAQIKLYYSGLVEYNVQNGLASNAVWQFLDDKNSPVTEDKIEFISNGDGKLFTKRITALVKFDKAGAYVLINYNEDLKELKDGAQIKLLRPRSNTNSHGFYEQCKVIKVTDGKIDPVDNAGTLNYFDAYMVNRQIPIPFYDKDLKKDTTKSVLKTFTFPFEHHSPSDFWGDHLANRGRVFAHNPFENRLNRSTEISLSKALSGDGLQNGLSYFEEIDTIELDKQEWGSITILIPGVRSLGVICQNSTFEVGLDDNTVRANRDGTLSANSLNRRLGAPARKTDYGCHQEDINTIREYKGLVMFIDRSEAALVELFNGQAQDVSLIAGFKGYLKDKIKYMVQYNTSGAGFIKYFHGVIDPKRKQFLLTLFTLPQSGQSVGGAGYVNQLREKNIEANETLGYSILSKALMLTYSFTPEYYGTMYGHAYDNQLLSFKNAVAYIHHKKRNPEDKTYLNFYGQPCEVVYEPVLNAAAGEVKKFQFNEVLCREAQFFIDRIITESGQRSRLLLTHWDKRDEYYAADFKMDLNTYPDPNIPVLQDKEKVILEGNPLSGKWIKARYILRFDGPGTYFEMDGVTIHTFVSRRSNTNAEQ